MNINMGDLYDFFLKSLQMDHNVGDISDTGDQAPHFWLIFAT